LEGKEDRGVLLASEGVQEKGKKIRIVTISSKKTGQDCQMKKNHAFSKSWVQKTNVRKIKWRAPKKKNPRKGQGWGRSKRS